MAKTPIEIASLARSHTRKAVRVLASIMNMPDSPHHARVAAAVALLDRGWGKPKQSHEAEITHRCTKPLRGREPVAKVCSPIVQLRMLDLRI